VADEPTIGELSRRLDGVTAMMAQLVQRGEYASDQRLSERRFSESERRFTELEQDVAEIRKAMEKTVEKRQTNARQALYAGILPAVFILLGIAVQIWLAARGA
jgi:Skp family chaperone for outer membrane proteins